jgi:hypothetical protein
MKVIRKRRSVKSRNHGGSLILLKEELVERLWRFQLIWKKQDGSEGDDRFPVII